jgi:hypothetical protein
MANFMAVINLGDEDRVAVVAIPQEWTGEGALVVEAARQKALSGDPSLLRAPDGGPLPSDGTRFMQFGTHAVDGSRFVIDAAATVA